jgi:hypothetical protein
VKLKKQNTRMVIPKEGARVTMTGSGRKMICAEENNQKGEKT